MVNILVKSGKRVWLVFGVVFLLTLAVVLLMSSNRQKMTVLAIERDGQLRLSDGRVVSLAGLRMRSPGEEEYEAANFLLSQMVEDKEVVVSKESDAGYSVWIGCVKNIFGSPNCSRGLQVNEELTKVGAAEKI